MATKHRDVPGHSRLDKRHNDALSASTSSPAGAVGISLGIFRWIVMHHDFHAIHVNASRRNICRDKDWLHTAGEGAQRPLALWLAQAAVQGAGTDPGDDQFPGQPIGGALGANKEQRTLRVRGNRDRDINLRLRRYPDKAMLHRGNIFVPGHNLVANRVVLVALHKAVDVSIERCREEECLVLLFDPAEDAFDLRHEAHVGHLVGFIEHDRADFVKRECAAFQQVVETARSGDDDVDAGPEDIGLAV